MARQALAGLRHLHRELRVIHRDIKPSNMLLTSSGQLKITDFGVSGQLTNSVSQALSWVGTLTYMSPERIKGESYSFNSDVWSLGLLLVQCAIGRFPYTGEACRQRSPLLHHLCVIAGSLLYVSMWQHCTAQQHACCPTSGLLLSRRSHAAGTRSLAASAPGSWHSHSHCLAYAASCAPPLPLQAAQPPT